TVVAAVKRAKVTLVAGEAKPNKELLQQLSRAGAFIRDKQFDQAVAQLNTALKDSFAAPETGFVMGKLLCLKEEWQRAAAVYREVVRMLIFLRCTPSSATFSIDLVL